MSKVIERLVCQQLVRFLEKRNLLLKSKSPYRRYHSTETAVLKIVSDALLAAEKGEVTLLGMLDMSAAFDTDDYVILLKRLHMSFGNGKMSETSSVTYDVAQGSVLGPIMFLLYTADVTRIVAMHGINLHSYADNSESYLHAKADEIVLALPRVASCIDAIDRWMSSDRVKLNSDKTQFIVLDSRPQSPKVKCDSIRLGDLDIPFMQKVTCLGVILDTELSTVQHLRGLTSRCFYQLRQIRALRESVIIETSMLLVHALVNSRLDYCNSILYGVEEVHL